MLFVQVLLHVQVLIRSGTFIKKKGLSMGLSSLWVIDSNHLIHRPMDGIPS